MPKAILHGGTRVLRRLTTDPTPVLAADEIMVMVPDGFSAALDGKPCRLAGDNITKVPASDAELDAAFPERALPRRMRELLVAIDDVVNDPLVEATVKRFCAAFRRILSAGG